MAGDSSLPRGWDLSRWGEHRELLEGIAKARGLSLEFEFDASNLKLTITASRDGTKVGEVIVKDQTHNTGSLMWKTSNSKPSIVKTVYMEFELEWVWVDSTPGLRGRGIGTLLMAVAFTLSLRLRRGIRYHWEPVSWNSPIKYEEEPDGGQAKFHDSVLKRFNLGVKDVRFPGKDRSIHLGAGRWASAYLPYELLEEREVLFEQYVKENSHTV
jgi:hypothetical protein